MLDATYGAGGPINAPADGPASAEGPPLRAASRHEPGDDPAAGNPPDPARNDQRRGRGLEQWKLRNQQLAREWDADPGIPSDSPEPVGPAPVADVATDGGQTTTEDAPDQSTVKAGADFSRVEAMEGSPGVTRQEIFRVEATEGSPGVARELPHLLDAHRGIDGDRPDPVGSGSGSDETVVSRRSEPGERGPPGARDP